MDRWKLWPVLLMMLLVMPAASASYDWCYQEFANESTACGGLDTGSYSAPGNAVFDGNWFSYMSDFPTTEIVTYYKPFLATNDSLWLMAYGFNEETFFPNNYTIPAECWSSSRLMFEIKSAEGPGGPENSYGCYDDGMAYYAITTSGYMPLEEAIWWDMQPAPIIYDMTGAKIVAWTLAIILFLWIVPKMGRVN